MHMNDEAVRPVAALILDGARAPETARRAAALARKENRPLILLVPVERTGFSLNPLTHRLAAIRQTAEAETIAARVRPALESTGTEAEVRPVPCLSRHEVITGGAAVKRITAAARRIRADILVTPTGVERGTTTQTAQRRRPIKVVGSKARPVRKEQP